MPLDTLPMSSALSQDGKYLLVLNGGYRPPSISVVATDAQLQGDRTGPGGGRAGSVWRFRPTEDVYVGGGSHGRRLRVQLSPTAS